MPPRSIRRRSSWLIWIAGVRIANGLSSNGSGDGWQMPGASVRDTSTTVSVRLSGMAVFYFRRSKDLAPPRPARCMAFTLHLRWPELKTMARTTADVLADRLIDWGVRVIFG